MKAYFLGDFFVELFNKLGEWLLIVAGVMGGLIGARIHPESTRGVGNFAFYIGTGFCFAVFAVPAFAQWAGITGDRVLAGMGFFAAMFWMPIADKIKSSIAGVKLPWVKGGN